MSFDFGMKRSGRQTWSFIIHWCRCQRRTADNFTGQSPLGKGCWACSATSADQPVVSCGVDTWDGLGIPALPTEPTGRDRRIRWWLSPPDAEGTAQ